MSDLEAPITNLFPDIIIFEILTRLPPKIACRFKLVSKRSNALISHSHFLSTYLSRNPPSSWVPLYRTIRISNTCPFPTHLPLTHDGEVHTFSINPRLLLKPGEPIPGPEVNQFPAMVLHASAGLVLFTVNILPESDPNKLPFEKFLTPWRTWMEIKNGRRAVVVGVDPSYDLLFVMNPVTNQWARLPLNPDPPGGLKVFFMYCYCLVACGATGEFVVGLYARFDGKTLLTCYSSKTGEWVKKNANYPLGSRSWSPGGVFELEGKMYWVDLAVGMIKWETDDVFAAAVTKEEEAVCVFIPLPSGREKMEEDDSKGSVRRNRYVGPAEGNWIQYVEMMEEGECALEVWRWADNEKEWKLVYQVSKFNIERGFGYGFDLIGFPSALCVDPTDADVAILNTKQCIFPVNGRTQVVGRSHSFDGGTFATSVVLPSWPTPMPPRLYPEYLKEQGNGYFKAQDFNEAVKCYSKSISLSPTATAYANRAMSYLKVSKFHEAEDDCTEALNLNSGLYKVYVRRALARKELGNLDGALEDVNHALSLEPDNEEVKERHAEIKSLHEKASAAEGEHDQEGTSADVDTDDEESANCFSMMKKRLIG